MPAKTAAHINAWLEGICAQAEPTLYLSAGGDIPSFVFVAPIWIADFTGSGHAQVMFYYSGGGNWWLGTL